MIQILLADDHEVVRLGIREALDKLPGFNIIGEVGDGPGLFSSLGKTEPDFLLLDITMPQFQPIADIQKIRRLYPAMKILIIGAHDDDIYVKGLLAAGVDGYHLKDRPLSDLNKAIERILAGEKWVSDRLVNKLVNYTFQEYRTPISLTARQKDILTLLMKGLNNKAIANKIGISVKTIEAHLTRIYRRLNVESRLDAVNFIREHPEILVSSSPIMNATDTITPCPEDAECLNMLLVDDNARYRHRFKLVTEKMFPHMLLYEAETIPVAIQITERVLPELAFVDVVLGDESGIQCTQQIKAKSPKTRIVLISAYPDRGFRQQSIRVGAVAFLDKRDLDATAIKQIIEDVMK